MAKQNQLLEYWQETVRQTIVPFSDSGELVKVVVASGRRFHVEWAVRGREREAEFAISRDGTLTVGPNRETFRAYLAGPEMADLRQVAHMISRSIRSDLYIPLQANCPDEDNARPQPAIEILDSLLDEDDLDATRVIMLTGEAGAGKTLVLRELVRRRAKAYLDGRTRKLLLYVNAQGRALARLNEALATELQDLRVSLTYHSVATLSRLGLLVPVIDGFDELLGVSGYDDAFSSLGSFLERMEGEGQLLASARSVYYEEEFLERANGASTSGEAMWTCKPVTLLGWDEDDQSKYLTKIGTARGLSESDIAKLRTRTRGAFKHDESQLASKPWFFAKTVDLLLADPEFSGGDHLLDELVHGFLRREQRGKLLDRQQVPLLEIDQLERLLGELAEEMWNQETRELDYHSVREVAEITLAGSDLSESVQSIVTERMPTTASLATGGDRQGSIAFEHEVFFFYFLAKAINRYLSGDSDMRLILSRSSLPEEVAEHLSSQLQRSGQLASGERLQAVLDRLSGAASTKWRRTTQVRENGGLIAMAVLRAFSKNSGAVESRRIRALSFPGSNLAGVTMEGCFLDDVRVQRTNLSQTKLLDCRSSDLVLVEPRLSPDTTRLEIKGLQTSQVIGLKLWSKERLEEVYDPVEIEEILRRCGAPIPQLSQPERRAVPEKMRGLLERVVRAYGKRNTICTSDENLTKAIFGQPEWMKLRGLLEGHEIIKPVEKSAGSSGGRNKEFLRLQVLQSQLMRGETEQTDIDPRIRRLWDDLRRNGAQSQT